MENSNIYIQLDIYGLLSAVSTGYLKHFYIFNLFSMELQCKDFNHFCDSFKKKVFIYFFHHRFILTRLLIIYPDGEL